MKKSIIFSSVFFLFVASVAFAAEPVKIGFISVLSGPLAPIGKSEENAAVMAVERRFGHEPRDVSKENRGYDVESVIMGPDAGDDRLRFIEVKGRISGAETVTITKNEILTALNKPDDWLLALVEVPPAPDFAEALMVGEDRPSYGMSGGCVVRYVQRPFTREPDFGATSVNYGWRDLWARVEAV